MKAAVISMALMALATEVAAFPAIAAEHAKLLAQSQIGKRSTLYEGTQHKKRLTFDPESQYVSTKGEHAFVSPNFAAGDVRGPCPGLNAAANHGYIPHNGVGTIGDFINGTNVAYGMALDLGGFLALFGSIFDGNLL